MFVDTDGNTCVTASFTFGDGSDSRQYDIRVRNFMVYICNKTYTLRLGVGRIKARLMLGLDSIKKTFILTIIQARRQHMEFYESQRREKCSSGFLKLTI